MPRAATSRIGAQSGGRRSEIVGRLLDNLCVQHHLDGQLVSHPLYRTTRFVEEHPT